VAHIRGRSLVRQVRSAPRRLTVWGDGPGADDLATLDVLTFSASTNGIVGVGREALIPFTITRIRGFLDLMLTAATTAGDGFHWAAGIGIVSAEAFSIGITAVPKPFADKEWPGWLWFQMGTIMSPIVLGNVTSGPQQVLQIPIDSRAMRKIAPNEVVTLIVEFAEHGAAVCEIRGATRMLSKLH